MAASVEGVGNLRLPDGCKCVSSISQNFGYYDSPVVETAQASFYEDKILPTNGLDSDPYEFVIETVGDTFLCMNNMYMYCKAKVVDADGSDFVAGVEVAPINNTLSSLWRTVETKLNNVTINPASSYNYAQKEYLQSILSVEGSNYNVKHASIFVMDTPGQHDTNNDNNAGFKSRKAVIKESKPFDMCGEIACDFLRSDNHLAPGHKLSLRFTRTADSFFFQTSLDTKFKLKITDLAIYVRRLRLTPEALTKVIKPRQSQRYMSTHTEMKEFPLASGIQQWSTKIFAGGRLPKQVIVAMVKTKAQVGEYKSNPYNYKDFKIKKINLKMNGTRIPQEPLELDISKDIFQRAFNHLFMNTGKFRINSGNCITDDAFQKGSTVFPFDLTPDLCNGFHTHAGNDGSLELEMEWAEALTEGITVLVYAASDQVVFVNGEGNPDRQPQVSVF